MKKLNYATLQEIGYTGFLQKEGKNKVLQFGEGNFLRAFVDNFIDVLNEKCDFNAKVIVTQPIEAGLAPMINEQEGLYTLYLRGMEDGKQVNNKRVISCISHCINPYSEYQSLLDCAKEDDLRYIVSNTTEAGITFDDSCKFDDAPPSSFPAKLTRFLYERFTLGKKGFVILSCELIDNNGKELLNCVDKYIELWKLSDEFKNFVHEENLFCSTLVDRIATGYPRKEVEELNKENGYEDNLIDTAEVFGFWVIEGPESLKEELPFEKAGLPVLITDDHTPYKKRKVRILNGAHTSMIMAAYLGGKDIVRECMEDEVIRNFMDTTLQNEIIPTLDLPKEELESFANAVIDRFNNPYIDHELLSISLNSTAKWKARVMPTLTAYVNDFNTLPTNVVFSFASYIAFYRGTKFENGALTGKRNSDEYKISDDAWIIEWYGEKIGMANKELVNAVCTNEKMWGTDLTKLNGFEARVCEYLDLIDEKGMYEAIKEVNGR